MKLLGVTYKNTEITDWGTFGQLPESLQEFLKQSNGIIAYKGGLHIRGCCKQPLWHSIDEVWSGKHAFWKLYPDILDIDIPFAQDCMGDQYFLRSNRVIKLSAETGEIEFFDYGFVQFLEEIEKDPVTYLGMQPLIQYEMEGKSLEPGKLLQVFPPFALNSGAMEMSLKEQPILNQIMFLAEFSKKYRGTRDGDCVEFIVE